MFDFDTKIKYKKNQKVEPQIVKSDTVSIIKMLWDESAIMLSIATDYEVVVMKNSASVTLISIQKIIIFIVSHSIIYDLVSLRTFFEIYKQENWR